MALIASHLNAGVILVVTVYQYVYNLPLPPPPYPHCPLLPNKPYGFCGRYKHHVYYSWGSNNSEFCFGNGQRFNAQRTNAQPNNCSPVGFASWHLPTDMSFAVHSPLPSVIHIGDADVPFVSSVKNLGVTLDSNLSMSQHISNTCKAAYIQIRHISSIRLLLTTQTTQTFVCSLVLSRLKYCNSLLSGCPQYLLDKLQKVQNAAARLVCKTKKSDHIHHILETLHWLPVTHRIQYKISTSCFHFISGTAPQYLSDLLQPYTPARQLRSASDTRTFVTPRVNTKTFGERSFSYAGPSVWNNLPQTLRHSDSTSSFKTALKTHLLNNYF